MTPFDYDAFNTWWPALAFAAGLYFGVVVWPLLKLDRHEGAE